MQRHMSRKHSESPSFTPFRAMPFSVEKCQRFQFVHPFTLGNFRPELGHTNVLSVQSSNIKFSLGRSPFDQGVWTSSDFFCLRHTGAENGF